jgi:hypothetical protein
MMCLTMILDLVLHLETSIKVRRSEIDSGMPCGCVWEAYAGSLSVDLVGRYGWILSSERDKDNGWGVPDPSNR